MADYSGTPLIKKLGIKPEMQCLAINTPPHYSEIWGELPSEACFYQPEDLESFPFIHLFCKTESELHNLFPISKSKLDKNGSLWVSWIKKASRNQSWSITDMDVRNYGLHLGLVDVKVCAVDADWSGLKFMYRKDDRG